jgi:CBS domain-containing protein
MGVQDANKQLAGEHLRRFMNRLLADLRALEKMVEDDLFESDVRRFGAEQELFLADEGGRPVCASMSILEKLDDYHFTTELAQFNLEFNMDPFVIEGKCLSEMERQASDLLKKAQDVAIRCGADTALTGILPSLRKSDLGRESMTPLPRYNALDESTRKMREGLLDFRIKGVDELSITHDSVMLESCNASFQIHLQVTPKEFAGLYNASQALAGPLLAAASNSPLLFGRRLWQETRIALFQQAVETRKKNRDIRQTTERVYFGKKWVKDSVSELFKEDITRFRTLLGADLDEDPLALLKRGVLPELKALRLHTSTIWRWNRACYGITDGKPHLRIENRILPSGPSVLDEVANSAFWLGLMLWSAESGIRFSEEMEFETAKENFIAAARNGLKTQFTWFGGKTYPADRLILDELIPRAREGLAGAGLAGEDSDRYLGVIHERVKSGRTGSKWLLASLTGMKNQGTASERLSALTRASISRLQTGEPVHNWKLAELKEAGGWTRHYVRVEQYMTTDLVTVREEDSVELVANMMDWERVRHVLVEDEQHQLRGLVSYRSILRVLARGERDPDGLPCSVSAVMKKDPKTVSPETETLDAIELMRKNSVGCLPVVKDGRLVGIVTERDFVVLTRELLLQKLKEQTE